MSKVYIINDGDIEKLTLGISLSEFQARFPLHAISNKPDDLTSEEEQAWAKRWAALVDEAHRHFTYHIHGWLNDTVRR